MPRMRTMKANTIASEIECTTSTPTYKPVKQGYQNSLLFVIQNIFMLCESS